MRKAPLCNCGVLGGHYHHAPPLGRPARYPERLESTRGLAMKPSDVLIRARALIEDRGWCQGDFTDDAGHLCGYGACWVAAGSRFFKNDMKQYQRVGGFDSYAERAASVAMTMLDVASPSNRSFFEWQDEPGTDLDDVRGTFDIALSMALSDEAAPRG